MACLGRAGTRNLGSGQKLGWRGRSLVSLAVADDGIAALGCRGCANPCRVNTVLVYSCLISICYISYKVLAVKGAVC